MHPVSGKHSKAKRLLSSLLVLCFLGSCTQASCLQGDAQARSADLWRADLDGDGEDECLQLMQGGLQIDNCAGQSLWQSPKSWDVTETITSDLDRDGAPELTLLVWRPFEPWPVDRFMPHGGRIDNFHDRHMRSCHVILIGWKGGAYDEIWAGSALVRPLSDLHAEDLDGDGWQELAALEGTYDEYPVSGALTIWEWLGFGFSLVSRQELSSWPLSSKQGSNSVWIPIQ